MRGLARTRRRDNQAGSALTVVRAYARSPKIITRHCAHADTDRALPPGTAASHFRCRTDRPGGIVPGQKTQMVRCVLLVATALGVWGGTEFARAQDGHRGHGHAQYHDWYKELKNGEGVDC